MKRALLAIALTASSAAFAQSESNGGGNRDPNDVDAWRTTRERVVGRLTELDADTRSYLDMREAEERARLESGFRDPMNELEQKEAEQRALAIARMETFLAEHPGVSYNSHVRFRLADLYFEQATEEWQAVSAEYYGRLETPNLPIEELEAMGPPPRRDLAKSTALYERIIADNKDLPPEQRYERLDGTYLMLGFVLNDRNSVQFDEARARALFAELIQVLPESELADRSHLFLGNFAFADNSFEEALAEYEAVVAKGPEGKYFEEALYQLAWAKYKLNEFDESLALFTRLLDLSENTKAATGKESAFAPDARRFVAFSFADVSLDQERPAVEVAREWFAKSGPRTYEREVYRQLADVLIRYSRSREATEVYRHLQDDPRWIEEPDNPAHQIALIYQFQTAFGVRNLEQAGIERLAFIDRYSENTEWWQANRNDPEALEVARDYIESSLLDVAIEYRVRAQESGLPADYALAAAKYTEYLDKFPISDDYYKQQWYLADSLKLAGMYDESLLELESLMRSHKAHEYGDAALYSAMDVRLQTMTALGHPPDQPPVDSPVERTETLPDGRTLTVYALTTDRVAFVTAADAVTTHTFGPSTDPELPDYRQAVEERRPAIQYVVGQMLFYHNRFDEARPRFEALIAAYPRAIESNYAAGLLVDSYLAEGDLAQVRAYTKRFTLNPPGPPQTVDAERFKGTLEGSTFKLALDEAEAPGTDPLSAAAAFLAFRQEFPSSEFSADALYNAAYYPQQAGKVEQANALYEQFVAENPQDERSKGLYFRIAANYEAAFELSHAVTYYDKVLSHPSATPVEKADAQYNKSFLLIGLGRHKEAAQGFEAYESKYLEQEDREQIMWLAGEEWEEVSRADAIEFYNRYKKKYPDANPDHYLEAEARILELMKEQGADPSRLRRQSDAISAAFDRFTRAGKPIGPNGHRAAASAAFPALQTQFDKYADDKLSGNEDRDTVMLNETKPKELRDLEANIKDYVSRYQSFEHSSAALLLQAKAALYLADLGLSIRCPPGLSDDDCFLYEDILEEQVFPAYYEIEEVGLRRLQELVQAAKDKKRHSPSIDEAMKELNRRRPTEFPAVKKELEGGTDSSIPIDLVPKRTSAPSPVPAPAPEEPG